VRHSLTPEQLERLAASAHGFVAADLAALANEAALCALRRVVAAKAGGGAGGAQRQGQQQPAGGGTAGAAADSGGAAAPSVEWGDFLKAQSRIKPSALREVAVEVPKVRQLFSCQDMQGS
jgi:AAA family ATPase